MTVQSLIWSPPKINPVDESAHAVGNENLMDPLECHALQARQQGPPARAPAVGAQTPEAAPQQQQHDRAYPNPFRVYSNAGH
jgi:hypothetical protein